MVLYSAPPNYVNFEATASPKATSDALVTSYVQYFVLQDAIAPDTSPTLSLVGIGKKNVDVDVDIVGLG